MAPYQTINSAIGDLSVAEITAVARGGVARVGRRRASQGFGSNVGTTLATWSSNTAGCAPTGGANSRVSVLTLELKPWLVACTV